MNAALDVDRHRTIAEQLADPAVIVEYRPGVARCAYGEGFYEGATMFAGPERRSLGPDPADVLRRLCRDLRRRPEQVLCDPDPKAPAGGPPRCYLTDDEGVALARLTGIDADQINDAVLSVCASGWLPGERETVSRAVHSAADRMPAARTARPVVPIQAALL